MRFIFWLIAAAGLLAGCTSTIMPIGFWSRNRLRADGSRQGPWRTYYDSAETRLATRGHYRRDKPTRHWRYYHYIGGLDHTEYYQRPGHIRLRYYHPNGQLWRRGQAQVEVLPDSVRFYWHGLWQLYDTTGRVSGWELYDRGWRAGRGAGR